MVPSGPRSSPGGALEHPRKKANRNPAGISCFIDREPIEPFTSDNRFFRPTLPREMGDTNAAVAWCSFSPEIGKYLFTACETLSLIDETGFPPRRFNPQNKLPGAINMSFY